MADDFQVQTPADLLDWAMTFADFLAEGDSVSSYAWTIDPDSSPSHLTNASAATVKVDGLSFGLTYRLACKIVTANGIEAERSVALIAGVL